MEIEQQVLSLLSDGKFHSGAEVGKVLGVTRAAIWKALKRIQKKYALEIYAVKGKGYRLDQTCELLTVKDIHGFLQDNTRALSVPITVFISIPSTHLYALEHRATCAERALSCALYLAEHQSKGRGRRGRTWVSPFASNIYLSLYFKFQCDSMRLIGLSLVVALAIVRALKVYGIEGVGVKWPNDIYWQGKKLAGVLIDLVGEMYHTTEAVISLGLNVAMTSESAAQIDQAWVDVRSIIGALPSRNQLAGLLLSALLDSVTLFEKEGLNAFTHEWETVDLTRDRAIIVSFADQTITGFGRGITARGELLVENEQGIQCVQSADVSLRLHKECM